MKFSLKVLFAWILSSYYNIITAQGSFPAVILIHDGNQFDLIDKNTHTNYESIKFTALACPGEETLLDEESDLQTENSLIIVKILQPQSFIEDDKICKTRYSTNIAFDRGKKSYMFGYKFYFTEDQVKSLFYAIRTDEKLEYESWNREDTANLVETVKNFFWFIVMNVEFNNIHPIVSVYEINPNKYNGNVQNCENYDLGYFFDDDKNIDTAFEKEKEFSILNAFLKPKLRKTEIDKMYLIKQQLAPIDDFDSYSKRLVTCSNLNVAPMWQTIANGAWKRVEEYIKEVARNASINVSTGTFGILNLPESTYPYNSKAVHLSDTAVPELYWKLVKYVELTENQDQLGIHRGILIITFNHISGTVGLLHKSLCKENVCKILGWEIENDNYETGFTYCCRPERHILQKLGVQDAPVFSDFDLGKLKKGRNNFGSIVL